jgi:hypothetical protein
VVAVGKAAGAAVDVVAGEVVARDRVAWAALRRPGRAATVFARIVAIG